VVGAGYLGGTAHTRGDGRANIGGAFPAKSAGEAVSVTERQLIEAIQDGVVAYVQVVAAFL
jgi:hypothetical protein